MQWINYLLLALPFLSFAVPYEHHRRPSHPFISGDGFRASCDYAYDEEDSSLDPKSVKRGGTIFVKTDMLGNFFMKIHPDIPDLYILVSHNSDDDAPGPYAAYLDDEKLIAWFAQNVTSSPHPKLHPIPIGIANSYWAHGNSEWLQKAIDQKGPKMHLAYFNMTIQNYLPERWQVYQLFLRAPFCYRPVKKRFDRYLEDLCASKFVLAPRGNGLDTHRLWESLYVGAYPIVKASPLDSLYEGLPVVVVNDWNEVTEALLNKKYEEFSQKTFSMETIQMDYWIKKIDSYKPLREEK